MTGRTGSFPTSLKPQGNRRSGIHLNEIRNWIDQIRDGQIDQRTSKQDSKSTSRDHVFIVMTLATDQLTAKRWFQWEIEG